MLATDFVIIMNMSPRRTRQKTLRHFGSAKRTIDFYALANFPTKCTQT